jgi:Fe-S-cluster containining protein
MQKSSKDLSILPPLYTGWISELLRGPIPEETQATCQDCVMCDRNGRNKSEIVFNPETKCCTFNPQLPNFLVGRILSDDSQAAKSAMETQLLQGIATPLGVDPPRWYTAQYKDNPENFGIDTKLLCPFYLPEANGVCSIRNHRNSRCATFFCKFNRGSVGVIFWKYMDQLLSRIEKLLSRWCVLQLNPGEKAIEELFPPPMTEIDYSNPSRLWGKWFGKEKEFYKECSKLVDPLSWDDVSRICGADIEVMAHVTLISYRRLISDEIPAYLKVASWKKIKLVAPDVYRIWTYNRYDPFDVSREVFDALHLFGENNSVGEALQKNPSVLNEDLLRQLSDRGILEVSEP